MYVQAQQHRQCRAGDRHRVRDLRQHPQRGGAAGISQKVHCAVKVCTLMRGSAATSMRGVTASTKSWPWPMHRYDRRCGELVSRQTRRVVDVLRACREWWRRGYPVGACTWTDRVNGVSVTTNGRIAIRTQTARKVRARPGSNGHSGRENICDSAHSEVSLRTSSPRGALFAVTVCVATRARQPRRIYPPALPKARRAGLPPTRQPSPRWSGSWSAVAAAPHCRRRIGRFKPFPSPPFESLSDPGRPTGRPVPAVFPRRRDPPPRRRRPHQASRAGRPTSVAREIHIRRQPVPIRHHTAAPAVGGTPRCSRSRRAPPRR